MPSLLVAIFLIELAIQLINTVGATTINRLLWDLVNLFPSRLSKDFAEQRKLQSEYLRCRRELNATSSQDEFAKWAKLRRQHDKLLEQLEKKKSSLDASRSRFDQYVGGARWLGTRGLQYFLPFWYPKEPMFWLPHGLFPHYAEWLLSFPRAPLGSVSIVSWQLACAGVLKLLAETIVAVAALVAGTGSGSARSQQDQGKGKSRTPMAATGAGSGAASSQTAETKKEL